MSIYDNLRQATGNSSAASSISNFASPEAAANRATARAVAEEQNQRLEQLRSTKPTEEDYKIQRDIERQELLKLREENHAAIKDRVRQRTYDALDRFSIDKDVRHFNNLIRDLKAGGLPTGPLEGVTRVDKLSVNDVDLLTKNGYDADAVLQSPEALDALVKVTNSDGSVHLGTSDSLAAITGYNRYATARQLEEMQKRADILYTLRRGQTKPSTGSDFKGLTEDEADAMRRFQAEGGDMDAFNSGDKDALAQYNDLYNQVKYERERSSKVRNSLEADKQISEIDNTAQSEYGQDFFDLDMTDDKVRRKFERNIEKLESFADLKLDATDKKKLQSVKQLIAITEAGDISKNLSDKQTGLIDSFSNNVKKYVFDHIEGVEATSAYAAYGNILRNALYGSVLTPGEMKKFNEQFGNINQQTGPILVQFKVAMEQLKGDLQAVLDTNNSYVSHFRIGRSRQGLQNTIDGLDARIQFLDELQQGGALSKDTIEKLGIQQILPPDVEAELDAISESIMQ